MTMSFRRYLVGDVIGIAAMNAAINAGYTAWLWRSSERLAIAGSDGIAVDLAGTPVWIGVLATLLGTGAVQRKLWEGRFRRPGFAIPGIVRLLPSHIAWRAAAMGVLAFVAFALPTWLLLQAAPFETLPFEHAVVAKVALTVLFSAVIVPLVVLAAIADMGSRSDGAKNRSSIASRSAVRSIA